MTQTAGRAARNVNGKVIMYADHITASMQMTIDETARRREKQLKYNEEHNITPKQIVKVINHDTLGSASIIDMPVANKKYEAYIEEDHVAFAADPIVTKMNKDQLLKNNCKYTKDDEKSGKRS